MPLGTRTPKATPAARSVRIVLIAQALAAALKPEGSVLLSSSRPPEKKRWTLSEVPDE